MPIILKSTAQDGKNLEVTFLPEQGMNMVSYKKGNTEIIDQSTQNLFEERFAGLGPLIGPHFHRRNPSIIPKLKDESLFPHIARVKAQGPHDPFSHGIGRYAPWKVVSSTEHEIKATLSGKDEWNGVALSAIEGQNFTMNFKAKLSNQGLDIELSVVSDTDSIVGIHYYFNLPQGEGKIRSKVQNHYVGLDHKEIQPLPTEWELDDQILSIDLKKTDADFTFFPLQELAGEIILETSEYQLNINYATQSAENCWQLYHPINASFVCIEPLSAKNPRHPNLTVSSIKINLSL